MNVALAEEVLNHIHNWFVRESSVFSDFDIEDGALPEEIAQYTSKASFYRISGTYLNDGLHEAIQPSGGLSEASENTDLKDEHVDNATVSLLVIPKSLLLLIDEIGEWEDKYGEVAKAPFFSESFGGYQYEIRGYSSYGAATSSASGWRLAFANRLNPWRKMY